LHSISAVRFGSSMHAGLGVCCSGFSMCIASGRSSQLRFCLLNDP
jgi:hypothetical protein